MDTKKIYDSIKDEVKEDGNKIVDKAKTEFWKKPLFWFAICGGIVLFIGLILGGVIF